MEKTYSRFDHLAKKYKTLVTSCGRWESRKRVCCFVVKVDEFKELCQGRAKKKNKTLTAILGLNEINSAIFSHSKGRYVTAAKLGRSTDLDFVRSMEYGLLTVEELVRIEKAFGIDAEEAGLLVEKEDNTSNVKPVTSSSIRDAIPDVSLDSLSAKDFFDIISLAVCDGIRRAE